MKINLTIEGVGKTTLNDSNYLAEGGQGKIFVKDEIAYKIYHNPNEMIPIAKINRLGDIKSDNVLIPKHVIYENNSKEPIGYTMDFKKDTTPICSLFTKDFKQRNKISNENITRLIKKMQETIHLIHTAKCLVVDLNELNILINSKFDIPYFIDCDSFAVLPDFPATAIMESIRDPKIKNNKWTELSDWYSFAILSFYLLTNIHPYKGTHPNYKQNEWRLRMDEGASVFDNGVSVPKVVEDFNKIDPILLSWFKEIFIENKRLAPPESCGTKLQPATATVFKYISANSAFSTTLIEKCLENIIDVANIMGINYFVGTNNIYKGKAILPVNIDGAKKTLVCESNDMSPVICKLKNNTVEISDCNGMHFSSINANDMMYRNGCIYTVYSGKMIENSFVRMGEKTLHTTRVAAGVVDLSTQVFSGIVFQDLLGKKYINIPFKKGFCSVLPIKELDGFRILNARSEKNICGIMAEKKGHYYRLVLTFNMNYDAYTVRTTKDVSYSDINLTVLPNGISVLATDSEVEIFKEMSVKIVDNPPFTSENKLFVVSGSICYIDKNEVYSVKMGGN